MLGYGVKETTSTTGTGTLTLSSVSGFPRFAEAFAAGDLVEYSLLDSNGAPLECGIGTVGASNTLARTYPLVTYSGGTYNKNAPSAINLSGTTTVICTGSPGAGFPFIQAIDAGASYKAHPSGAWGLGPGPTSNTTLTANRGYFVPYLHVVNRPFAGIQCRVTTNAGTNAQLGLYRCGTTGLPTDLLQSGTISIASTGIKQVTFSTYYPLGWYFMAIVGDGAAQINSLSTSALPPPAMLGANSSNCHITHLTVDIGSATLPSPFSGTITRIDISQQVPPPHISGLYA